MAEEVKDAEIPKQESELSNLPFPHSRVKDIIKSKLKEGVFIKKQAAINLNIWLGRMAEKIAEEVSHSDRAYVSADDIRFATQKYESIEVVEAEKKRIKAHLEAMKEDINRMEMDIDRV
ncbi:MAG: hypothetical protein ACP5E4_04400 [Candidatus Aenigmatarchaeota archaeon]